jgi:hypothetical protein
VDAGLSGDLMVEQGDEVGESGEYSSFMPLAKVLESRRSGRRLLRAWTKE